MFEEEAAAKAEAQAQAEAETERQAAVIESARREVTESGGVTKAEPPADTGYLTLVEVEALVGTCCAISRSELTLRTCVAATCERHWLLQPSRHVSTCV